ncbi:hypothetical protein ACOJR9_08460 [Alteromonas sp. A081]|uniref:hypothetical protein n=1 Tax=Alteromonas sp. A081 TaxID=3410269 RepID=UPI003B985AAC
MRISIKGKSVLVHLAFYTGGYKKNQVLAETHTLALRHYQQTKNLLLSYGEDPLGCF